MDKENNLNHNNEHRIKPKAIALLLVVLFILVFEGVVIYNWQHNKVTSLQTQDTTLKTQLKYVQSEQDKLERQIK